MYKKILKLALITLVVVGGASLFTGGQAAADTCPVNSRLGNQIPANFGYNQGEQQDGFGGLVVASSVGTMTNGQPDANGRTGNPIDAKYNLNSSVPNAPTGYGYHLDGHAQDDRIFTVNAANQTTNRDHQRWFGTDASTGDRIYDGIGSPGYTCPGWDALGPGTSIEIGDRHALDCGEAFYAASNPALKQGVTPSRFWISDLPSPNGESGQWEVIGYAADGSTRFDINNFSSSSMGPNDWQTFFTIKNGATVRINLVWHADPPPPPDVDSECTHLHVQDGGTWTRPSDGKVFASGDVRTKVRVEDSGGHALVHPANDDPSQYFYLNDESRDWYYTPLAKDVHVIVIREYKSSSGVWNTADDNSRWHYNCYNSGYNGAGCAISVNGNVAGKPIGVKAGSQIAVTIDVGNIGTLNLPSQLAGHEFWFDSDGGQTGGLQSINVRLPTIGVGRTYQTTVVLNAPGSVGHYHFSGSPTYRGLFYPGVQNCGYDIDVYQPFNVSSLTASTQLTPSRENPTGANYSTNLNITPSSPQVYVPTSSSFYKIPAGGGPQPILGNSGGIYPSGPWSGTYPILAGSFNAGDQYCAKIDATAYTGGWIGPNGPYDVAETNGQTASSDPPPHCDKVINEPYAHFTGNDLSAGGGFGQSCNQEQAGNIYTYNESNGAPISGGYGGSGTQFGAEAMNIISGLGSASLRNSSPTGVNGLTFANNDPHIGGSQPARTNGGYLGSYSNMCVPDYWSDKPGSLAMSTLNAATAGGGATQQYYKPSSGTLTLNSGTIANTVNQTIFVDGNVHITGSGITYSNAARNNVSDIPSFYLIVKNGNIHIDSSVTQLDGAYIAQPDTTSPATIAKTGIINTCYIGTISAVNNVYPNCKNQLVVNGAFVANKVLLARSYSSLRYSQNGEHNLGGYPSHSCGHIGFDVPNAGSANASDCAAEIFNFSPELYLSQPAINARFGVSTEKYDAITSLSPVL